MGPKKDGSKPSAPAIDSLAVMAQPTVQLGEGDKVCELSRDELVALLEKTHKPGQEKTFDQHFLRLKGYPGPCCRLCSQPLAKHHRDVAPKPVPAKVVTITRQSEYIRGLVIGAIRYGKTLAINVHDLPDISFWIERVNQVLPNLWEALMSKRVREEEYFWGNTDPERELFPRLVKKDDDSERYHRRMDYRDAKKFRLVFLAKGKPEQIPSVLQQCQWFQIAEN